MRLPPASALPAASVLLASLPDGASAAKRCLEAVMSGKIPIDRYPDAAGTVTVCFEPEGSESTKGNLEMSVTGIGKNTTGGVHIHEGTKCDDYGGHYFEPDNGDPWFMKKNPPIAPTGTGYDSDESGKGEASFEFDQGYGYEDSVGRTMVVHDTIADLGGDYAGVVCGVLAEKRCLEAVMSGKIPIDRYPDAAGTVTVCFGPEGSESTKGTLDMSVTGIGKSTTGGVHIHEGTKCDDYGGHYFEPDNGDPWFMKADPVIAPTGTGYDSDESGTGTATFEFDQGYGYDDSLGRTMIVHDTTADLGGDYAGVACGVLVAAGEGAAPGDAAPDDSAATARAALGAFSLLAALVVGAQ